MDDFARGASSSLNRSITELRRFVGRSSLAGAYGNSLRDTLDALIWEVGRKGFEAGYRAAHDQCACSIEDSGLFPIEITYNGKPRLAPSVRGNLQVRSTIQKIKIFKIPSFIREVSLWDRIFNR
jgi:hypothetical protein